MFVWLLEAQDTNCTIFCLDRALYSILTEILTLRTRRTLNTYKSKRKSREIHTNVHQ